MGAIHSERRNHQRAAALGGAVDDVGERVGDRAFRMIAVAIGRFAQKNIGVRGRFRVPQNGLVVATDIAGKNDYSLLPILGNRQLEPGGAQDVSGIVRADRKLGTDGERIVAGNFAKLRESRL